VLFSEILVVYIALYFYHQYYGVVVLMVLLISLAILGLKSRERHKLQL